VTRRCLVGLPGDSPAFFTSCAARRFVRFLPRKVNTGGSRGQLAAIAVIPTFLNYFLEQDLRELREIQHETATAERDAKTAN
jgi:hypothetical protein